MANLSKTLHINFYQNRSSIVEVMIKILVCFLRPTVYMLIIHITQLNVHFMGFTSLLSLFKQCGLSGFYKPDPFFDDTPILFSLFCRKKVLSVQKSGSYSRSCGQYDVQKLSAERCSFICGVYFWQSVAECGP